MSKRSVAFAAIAAVLSWHGTAAADQIVAASMKPLPLYAQPGGGTPTAKSDGQGMPWPVLETREDFYKIHVDGATYWVDSMHVRVARGSSAQCGPVVKGVPAPTGSTAGAGENVCR